jgi:hypothetical protein
MTAERVKEECTKKEYVNKGNRSLECIISEIAIEKSSNQFSSCFCNCSSLHFLRG